MDKKMIFYLTGVGCILLAARKVGASIPAITQLVSGGYKTDYDESFKTFGFLNNVDWRVLKAIAIQESNLNPNAVGDLNLPEQSYGLMQIQADNAAFYGISKEELMIPEFNIQVGSALMGDLVKKYGDINAAIQAYNEGPGHYDQGERVPDYLNKVLTIYKKLGV